MNSSPSMRRINSRELVPVFFASEEKDPDVTNKASNYIPSISINASNIPDENKMPTRTTRPMKSRIMRIIKIQRRIDKGVSYERFSI